MARLRYTAISKKQRRGELYGMPIVPALQVCPASLLCTHSNNLFLGAIEYMDMGDEARELAYEAGLLDL